MPALQLTGFGEPAEVVTLVSQPALVARRDEVVVALEAAPVHPSDIHLIRGFYGVRPHLPAPLGAEGVGKVAAVGPGADQALLGHRVAILPTYEQGTWADHVVVATRSIVAVSDDGDPRQFVDDRGEPDDCAPAPAFVSGRFPRATGSRRPERTPAVAASSAAKRAGVHTLNVGRRERGRDGGQRHGRRAAS